MKLPNNLKLPEPHATKSLEDTGVWINFNYYDSSTYPEESEAYTVKNDRGSEMIALWDHILQAWRLDDSFFVDKWLLEEQR